MTDSLYIRTVTAESFEQDVIQASHQTPVLADFWADWCSPCKMLMPVLAALAESYQGRFTLAKINSDDQQALTRQYGVRSLPTVKIFRNGQVVDEFVGAQPESAIRALIEKHIERPADQYLEIARQSMKARNAEAALEALAQAKCLEPENAKIDIATARALLLQGKRADARKILDALPVRLELSDAVKQLQAEIEFSSVAAEAPDPDALALRLAEQPQNVRSHYQMGAHCALSGEYEAALSHFFEVMRRDRKFEDDAGRKAMLSVFELSGSLPGSSDLVNRYRAKMFSVLH